MLLINARRIDILDCFPQHGVAAEIGTAQGYFAEYMLKGLNPKKLHLIDPWRFQDLRDYVQDANNTTDEEGDRRHKAILDKFAKPIRDGVVTVHRTLSTQIADSFADEHFDFIHVDGNHTYAACLADLYAFDRKVKQNGFITGHDYQTIPIARKENHNGVIQAVNNFVIEKGYTFVALTFEEAPTYIIAKNPDASEVTRFVAQVAMKHPIMAQIVNAEHKVFEQIEAPFSPQKYIFSFD
jgi:hypothetical protein